ncbi:hypothetical protein PQR57_20495 [Paraburkholderia dipogonis]|uniref:Uncharacterized protein n=1 Tax=Paraburkholderia dipogonis TaxID=1211383 RepID=A0ABW9AU18_9BURK
MNTSGFDETRVVSVKAASESRSTGLETTLYLLSSTKNALRLARSIAQLQARGVLSRELVDDGPTENTKPGREVFPTGHGVSGLDSGDA